MTEKLSRAVGEALADIPEDFCDASPEIQALLSQHKAAKSTWQSAIKRFDEARSIAAGLATVANLPAPIRRETIIKNLADALGTTVYEGRVKGKNRLGFFRPKLEEVRTKRANDLEVAAHELAHLIDDRIPEISNAWKNDKALAAELRDISYDRSKVYEGFAEGVRLWMTQPDVLQAKAPKVATWLDGFASRHDYPVKKPDGSFIIGNTFNLNLMPQIVAPLAEQAMNRNRFTDSPIETPSMENVQPFLRAKPNTSETMKALGMATRDLPESLQVNPVRTEALLRGYLNTWATYGLMLSDKAFFDGNAPAMRTDQMPVIRRFYSQEPPQHTKFETRFYDMLEEAQRLQGTMRELDRQGRPEIADEKERGLLAGEAKPLERAAKNVQQVNAEMMRVHRDKTLTPAAKRERLDALIVEKNALLKATVIDAEAAQKAKR